jgi:hybrid cluster-associated redox disulfide protein
MKVTKDMGILDAVNAYPDSVNVFQAYGMHCFGCMAARFENIEAGAIAHGIDPDTLIKSINDAIDAIDLTKEK